MRISFHKDLSCNPNNPGMTNGKSLLLMQFSIVSILLKRNINHYSQRSLMSCPLPLSIIQSITMYWYTQCGRSGKSAGGAAGVWAAGEHRKRVHCGNGCNVLCVEPSPLYRARRTLQSSELTIHTIPIPHYLARHYPPIHVPQNHLREHNMLSNPY